MSFNNLFKSFIPFVLIIVTVPTMFIPSIVNNSNLEITTPEFSAILNISNTLFYWPVPGYTRISSYYGKRSSPTAGASSFHQGIDIPAPNGSNLIAVFSGAVTFTGFNGSAGYSIHIKSDNLQFLYHHVSPNYIVKTGDYVYSGQVIGQVGPKNVYGIKNNPYKDSNGKPTNGATTRTTFTFHNKKRRQSRQSFKLFFLNLHIVFIIFFLMMVTTFSATSVAVM